MGVCAGLADYFEIDPTLVRIVFIILAFGGGAGILIYVILALIMPLETEKKSADSEKNIEENKMQKNKEKDHTRISTLGIILLILGGFLLWNQISPIKIASEVFWPTIMIVAGLWLVLRK